MRDEIRELIGQTPRVRVGMRKGMRVLVVGRVWRVEGPEEAKEFNSATAALAWMPEGWRGWMIRKWPNGDVLVNDIGVRQRYLANARFATAEERLILK